MWNVLIYVSIMWNVLIYVSDTILLVNQLTER
jgi:hypothetical protein